MVTVLLLTIVFLSAVSNNANIVRLDGEELCKSNCNSTTIRLVGPTQPTDTRPHPWITTLLPAKGAEFCQLGCQLFFTELPYTVSCQANCEWFYRFDATDGYSNLAEKAKLECFDGCDIAYEVCQAGFYCTGNKLIPCPAGTYRGAVRNVTASELNTAHSCRQCPYGTYRSRTLGTKKSDCTKCPVGTYLNALGSTAMTDCVRCPAGKWSDVEGMRFCKCIDAASCDLPIIVGGVTTNYFNNTIDFYRETVPFIGRW